MVTPLISHIAQETTADWGPGWLWRHRQLPRRERALWGGPRGSLCLLSVTPGFHQRGNKNARIWILPTACVISDEDPESQVRVRSWLAPRLQPVRPWPSPAGRAWTSDLQRLWGINVCRLKSHSLQYSVLQWLRLLIQKLSSTDLERLGRPTEAFHRLTPTRDKSHPQKFKLISQ